MNHATFALPVSTTVKVLKRAKELIATPAQWCQKALARDKDGKPVWDNNKAAVAYCLSGAVAQALREHDWHADYLIDPVHHRVDVAVFSLGTGYKDAWVFNNSVTFTEVHQALDAAIVTATEDPNLA